MTEARARYTELNAEYTRLMEDTLANPSIAPQTVPRLRVLASQLATAVEEVTRELAMIPNPSKELEADRDELVQRLQQIQRDYSGLLQATDSVETLRRIRTYQDTQWKPTFFAHLIAFFVLALLLVIAILVVRQRENKPISPMSTTINPALT